MEAVHFEHEGDQDCAAAMMSRQERRAAPCVTMPGPEGHSFSLFNHLFGCFILYKEGRAVREKVPRLSTNP